MRRKDREVSDFNEMISIMKKCDCCRLAMHDDAFPYIVPMNFGMKVEEEQVYLYFHCAKEGKKLDLIRKDNRVSFEMDCKHELIVNAEEMDCTMNYESVIGQGIIEFVKEEDKEEALKIIMEQYHSEPFEINPKIIPFTTVLRLKVLNMKGKRRVKIH